MCLFHKQVFTWDINSLHRKVKFTHSQIYICMPLSGHVLCKSDWILFIVAILYTLFYTMACFLKKKNASGMTSAYKGIIST